MGWRSRPVSLLDEWRWGEVPLFFPLMELPHPRTHCHCSNCSMMMMNIQTLASLFVVQIVLIWKKAQMNPHQLSLKVTCGPSHGWKLQNLAQVILTLKKVWVDPHQLNLEVTCLPFRDWTIRTIFQFGFLSLLWSVNGCDISSLLTVLTLTWTKELIEVVIQRFDPLV